MILAIDTSIGTSVALVDDDGSVITERESADPRGHAEAIGTLIAECIAGRDEITAVAVGMGPGPFTGLRVGIAAARAFARGRDVPVLPVLSHDAVAALRTGDTAFTVVTDAKRREHYATGYAAVADGVPVRVSGPALVPEAPVGPVVAPATVSAGALGALALRLRRLGLPTGPDAPQYLREPDVTPLGRAEAGVMMAAGSTPPNDRCTLRTATVGDLGAIMAIEHETFPVDAWPEDLVRSELQSPHGRYVVALDGGEVVGYAGVRVVGDQGDIQTVAVDAGHRRAGIGRAMLVELLAEARRRRAREVFLEVRADNPGATALYESLGFERLAVRPKYYQDGTDALVMRLARKQLSAFATARHGKSHRAVANALSIGTAGTENLGGTR